MKISDDDLRTMAEFGMVIVGDESPPSDVDVIRTLSDPSVMRVCATCKKIFHPLVANSRFCSIRCNHVLARERKKERERHEQEHLQHLRNMQRHLVRVK
jgi:predicted nucleic acid-binding Zn ribbon protein